MPVFLSGVFPALITPFADDTESVDVGGLHALVDHGLDGGVDGFVVCGGSGEVTSLSDAERRRILELVAERAAGRVSIIAHTGAMTTRQAVELSKHALACGADALMVGLPYYEPMNLDQVICYYSAIADQVDLPIMAYNYPYATGVNFTPEFTAKVADAVPGVRYLKDSAADLLQIGAAATALKGRVGIFSGSDTQSCPGLLLGAVGLVNGASNVFPGAFARMFSAVAAGDTAAATEVWVRLLPFLAFIEGHPFASAVKHALRIVGVPMAADVRAPAQDLTAEAVTELGGILSALT